MLVYNMTFSVDADKADEWLSWMRSVHIPKVQSTGLFETYKILKVLNHDDDATVSYAVQYFVSNDKLLENYFENDAQRLNKHIQNRWGESQVAFESLLKDVTS